MEETSASSASASSPPPPPPPVSENGASSSSSWMAALRERFTMPGFEFRSPIPSAAAFDYRNEIITDDYLSCGGAAVFIWIFVSTALIMCVYRPTDVHTGPYSSILLQANPIFVHSLKVENVKELKMPPMFYGFHRPPPLGITKIWSGSLYASVKPESNKDWRYYLNEGSQIKVSYNVPSSSSLVLVIAEGSDEIVDWLVDPSNPEATLSWNVIYGKRNGTIMQDVIKSSEYYVGVANVNSVDVEVNLSLSVRSSMYDTTNSSFKCDMTGGSCKLVVPFLGSHAAVLTTPGPQEGGDEVYFKVFYEPRWLTYLFGGLISITIWGFNLLRGLLRSDGNSAETQRAPLLSHKDDDLSSLCSSCDSDSQNGDELHENLEDGLGVREGLKKYNARRCVICLAASKDCFYIPCGHCASCFTCGTRIAEDAGICPICWRNIKVVRRIYNV